MSWMISNALMRDYENSLSLQVRGAGYSPANSSGGEQSAQSSENPTPLAYLQQDRMTAFLKLSRSGTMFAVFPDSLGEELLTWYLEDSLARISPSQEKEQDLTANDQASGLRCLESFAKYDHAESTWKIAQRSLFEDSEESLEIWPRWGMTVNGESFHAETSAEFTYASGSGLSLPTTGANEGKGSQKRRYIGSPEYRGAKMSEGLRTCEEDPIYLNPSFGELAMMWPMGWSDLRPLAMARFQEWQQQHSIS